MGVGQGGVHDGSSSDDAACELLELEGWFGILSEGDGAIEWDIG
jgi:hypothetical protein